MATDAPTGDRIGLGVLLAATAVVIGVYAAIVALTCLGPLYTGASLPPIAVTLFLFFGTAGTVVGGVFHGGIFFTANLVLWRSPRVITPARRRLLTAIGLLALVVLSVLPWLDTRSIEVGLRYQGRANLVFYAITNAVVLVALVVVAVWLLRAKAVRARTLLFIHLAAYVALLTLLLPYIGETP